MIGQTISHYRILEKLGEGGMGEVYLAEDTSLDRKVALKFLPPRFQDDEIAQRRFIREAKSAAGLDHPYICNIHEVGETDDGQDFIVMEYIEGLTLQKKLAAGFLSLKEALRVATEVSEALEKAHTAGIIHRDLKPSNIILTSEGHAKVMDFGLAKKVVREDGAEQDISSALTREGATLGTLAYMSPEQIKGDPLDHRSDVFSFGIVLYEMLTGVHPFWKAKGAETTAAILEHEPNLLTRFIDEVPELLQHTVKKLLAKNPEDRYQSIHEVRTNLMELSQTTELVPASGRPGKSKWIWITAAVLVLVFGAYWLFFQKPERLEQADYVPVPLTSYPGFEECPSFAPDGEQIAFSWNGRQQDNFDIYVKRLGPGEPLRLTDNPARDWSPVWSPDGDSIAFIRDVAERKSVVLLIPPLGGVERQIAEIYPERSLQTFPLTWDLGGHNLLVSSQTEDGETSRLYRLSVVKGEMEQITDPPAEVRGDFFPAVSPDGATLAFARAVGMASGNIFLLDLSENVAPIGEPRRITSQNSQIRGITWSEDGKEIVYSAGSVQYPHLWRLDRYGAEPPRRLAFAGDGVRHPTISLSSHRLVYQHYRAIDNIWRQELVPGTGTPVGPPVLLLSSSRREVTPAYSRSGSKIAFSSNRTGEYGLWVCDSNGSNLLQLTTFGGPILGSPRWSPDDAEIVFDARAYDGQSDLFVINAQGGSARRLTAHPSDDFPRIWSRDGSWIYFISRRSGAFEVWKLPPTGEEAEAVQVTRGGAIDVEVSPDGKYLYYLKWTTSGIWRMPIGGGEEEQVFEEGRPGLGLPVIETGIYYVRQDSSRYRSICFLDLETNESNRIGDQKGPVGHLALSPDGRYLLYMQRNHEGADLMLVEGFR